MLQCVARRALAFAAGGALVFSSGIGLAQQIAAVPPNQVTIDNFAFGPTILTVAKGTEIVWLNKDEEPHTVISVDKTEAFKSPALDTDDKFTHVFDKPGIYKYFCSIHSHMTGTIIVK
ncbi:MAG: cupredoxin family copper-binding protein [Alphaproteobacteria bacterium]|nr:cupredoxin family copper-binding protein [Alphaproteobacteria bacterium]